MTTTDDNVLDMSTSSATPSEELVQRAQQQIQQTSQDQQSNVSKEVDATILKRREIQRIRNDTSLDDVTKRLRIQQLMDGSSRSSSLGVAGGGGGNTSDSSKDNNSNAMIRRSSSSSAGATGGGTTTSSIIATSSSSNFVANNVDVMKCIHYEERKCNIVAPCCSQIFGCRVCHDEMVTDGHEINRFLIREIVCKECHTRQERSNQCINAKCTLNARQPPINFADYHCNICNLWMGTHKEPFHCDKCGICRVGGQANFQHCDSCAMCIRKSTFKQHLSHCLKDIFKNDCPVCREDMHTSRHSSMHLPCGHAIHSHCFRKLASFDYRCPICKKTLLNPQTMATAWQERARDIASQPMPPDLAKIVDIKCFDCSQKSPQRNWHFLGVQCPNCNSFNTTVERIINSNNSS